MSGSCGCCACLAGAGQKVDSFNRPGLSAIRYRAGTHATFFDAMIRRLTVPVKPDPGEPKYSLHALTTRELDDPAIALLDAWACAADVLTFYQERIANESYLRTALERRSMIELGRLVGYTLKPGVAASVHLAYTLEEGTKTIIPAGTKSQSIPGANEQPQAFETSEEIEARGAWNALRPRMRRPQQINVDAIQVVATDFEGNKTYALIDNVLEIDSVWIEGTNTVFEKRDPLLFSFKGEILGEPVYALRRVLRTVIDTEFDRTRLVLEPVRPYYIDLYRAALAAKVEGIPVVSVRSGTIVTPFVPGPIVELPPQKAAKGKKKAAKKAKLPAGMSVIPAQPLDEFLRLILLGTARSLLLARFETADPEFQAVFVEAQDVLRPVTPPTPATLGSLFAPLVATRALAPRSQFQFARTLPSALGERSDAYLRLLAAFRPELSTTIHGALANVAAGNQLYDQFRALFVLRRTASLFGHNTPDVLEEFDSRVALPAEVDEDPHVVYTDTPDDKITASSYAVVRNALGAYVAEVLESEVTTRSGYGISGRVSRLRLDIEWNAGPLTKVTGTTGQARLDAVRNNQALIRTTSLLVQSEELTLAQMPVDRPIGRPNPEDARGESKTRIELDGVVDGLGAGRNVIVRGERLIAGTKGVIDAELAMIATVEQETDVGAGGTPYSVLVLAPEGLAYEYKRSTVQILANVVPATNGATHAEIAGSGNAAIPLQTFTLHHTPLTFVAAPTVDGVRTTLAVRVDDALWHETDSLGFAGPNDRVYVTKTADDGKVSLTFGDGVHGQRLFTGSDNVRAVYRTGIGSDANCRPAQIATPIDSPLHVQGVVNPLAATGGANPESARDARRNIPVSLQAMGRVVSVEDFTNFARTFAGIAKATSKLLAANGVRFVHLTIGGTNDIPIDVHSDLYRNLVESLRKYGDPYQPFVVAVRARLVITGEARVRVSREYLWPLVAPKVRAALVDTFSYDRREFGQPVFPAEVIAAIQNVPGVEYVDLDQLAGIREEDVKQAIGASEAATTTLTMRRFDQDGSTPGTPAQPLDCDEGRAILPQFARKPPVVPGQEPPLPHELLPAEIAYLPPELADLFILTEIEHD